ncbi:MAG: undecaprenyldiphospho-muramoylpentapeptide beta-N-acetylglucosaminyltransferase [Hyphomicrobiaceae bacterium]|nr:undecaprenyldiphospho-muramoylpentapeptide beta-N-acetylglucosaminyltransferase [Hyphomicrobiaceae bacterium]
MNKPVVMIAAGGTGGHLFPAFALTEELGRRGYDVDLVTDVRADQYGIEFPGRTAHQVPSATLRGRSPVAIARTAMTLLRGVFHARALVKSQKPSVMVGFGGYPTVPPLLAARLCGVPFVIHEANAVMGRANRLLVRLASKIAVSFEKTKHLEGTGLDKVRLVGMPVRDAVLAAAVPYKAPTASGALSLLVFGGSQGARAFADIVPDALAGMSEEDRKRIRLVQQVREEDMDRVSTAYGAVGITAELATFFSDLPKRMAEAHLIVSRSGASTVAETAVLGRPAIYVPFPHALDNDQLENATRIQDVGGGWCIEQKDFTPDRLRDEISRLSSDANILGGAARAARSVGEPGAVAKLADVIEELRR